MAQSISVSPLKLKVIVGESFELIYTLEGLDRKNIELPKLDDFHIVGGPNTSQSMSWVNGKTTSTASISYYLSPKKAGVFTIEPAVVKTKQGRIYKSLKVSLTSLKAQQRNQTGQDSDHKEIMVRAILDTTNAVIGQQLTLTYVLYTQKNITNYEFSERLALEGFWVEDVSERRATQGQDIYEDQVYTTLELKRFALFPQKAGQFTLPNMNVTLSVEADKLVNSRRPSFFKQSYKKVVVTEPLDFKILPMPELNKPKDFTGAVGIYSLSSAIDNRTPKIDEAFRLRLAINGVGNLKFIGEPQITWPEDFEVFDPEKTENIRAEDGQITGQILYEYVIIPHKLGSQSLPIIEYSFFNPKKGTYEVTKSKEMVLNVGESETSIAEESKTEELVNQLHKSTKISKASKPLFPGIIFWVLAMLPMILSLGVIQFLKKQEAERGDTVTYKKNRAKKQLHKTLLPIQKLLTYGTTENFYESLQQAIWRYFSDKFNIGGSDFSKDKIVDLLQEHQFDAAIVSGTKSLLGTIEMAIYAPGLSQASPQQLFDQTVEVMDKIEDQEL